MKRRGFLGFMGGALAAGPGMVKEAASMESLRLPNFIGDSLDFIPGGSYPSEVKQEWRDDPHSWEREKLARLLRRGKEHHDYFRRQRLVQTLDPDIASYRSIALHRKISMQRDRLYERELEAEKDELLKRIAGWFE